MATFTKVLLSGSSQGKAIKVAATSSLGTLIHSTGSSTTIIDEIWLYAYNSHTSAVPLTIQFGGSTSPDNDIKVTIQPQAGLKVVVPGLVLTGLGGSFNSGTYAYAGTANVIMLSGYVNRIT